MYEVVNTAVFKVIVTEKTEKGISAHFHTVKVEVEKPWRFDPLKEMEKIERRFKKKNVSNVIIRFEGWEDETKK